MRLIGYVNRGLILTSAFALLAGCSLTGSKKPTLGDASLSRNTAHVALAFQANRRFGKSLSRGDRERLSKAEMKALEFGEIDQPVKWISSKKGVSGTVEVSQPFRVGQSSCRRFSHRMVSKTGEKTAVGTACRRSSGPWKLIR